MKSIDYNDDKMSKGLRTMARSRILLASALAVLVLSTAIAAAEEGGDPGIAIASGKATVAVRYRYEHVDQDLVDEKADASTARLRLNYRSGLWNGWSAFAEYDHVFHIFLTDFNSGAGTSPNKGQYPVVADPKGSDLNQLYLDYSRSDDWKYRLGRQRILLDNQRFVGGVGWRQNEQTYDALTLNSFAIPKTALSYSYVNRVRRIFGQTVPAGKARVDGHLLNAKVSVSDSFSLTPYFYYLDYATSTSNSTATVGVRVAANINVSEGNVTLLGEFATQSDVADATVSYDAQYAHLNAMWVMENGLSLGIGFESLGGDSTDDDEMFRTPLATLHAFQGWADRFLTTPDGGIDDLYATVKYKAGKWALAGVYHDFSSEARGGDYGSEFDVSAGRGFGKHYGVLFKGAFFSSDSTSYDDANKFWIMLMANY